MMLSRAPTPAARPGAAAAGRHPWPACDIVTADLRSEETAQWHKTYQLDANGRARNQQRERQDRRRAVRRQHRRRHRAQEGARRVAARPPRPPSSAPPSSRTCRPGASRSRRRCANMSGIVSTAATVQVEYRVKVPAGAEVKFTTVNGGIEITGLQGRITAETTNGGVDDARRRRPARGQHDERRPRHRLSRVPDGGVKLDFTNGGTEDAHAARRQGDDLRQHHQRRHQRRRPADRHDRREQPRAGSKDA